MIRPPQQLETLDPIVVQRNDLRLALPTIVRNYQSYYELKAQLIGLQNYVNTLIHEEQSHDETTK